MARPLPVTPNAYAARAINVVSAGRFSAYTARLPGAPAVRATVNRAAALNAAAVLAANDSRAVYALGVKAADSANAYDSAEIDLREATDEAAAAAETAFRAFTVARAARVTAADSRLAEVAAEKRRVAAESAYEKAESEAITARDAYADANEIWANNPGY